MHSAPDVLELEHGATPGGTGDRDMNRTGTEFGMAGDESVAASEEHGGVAVVKSLDFEDGRRREIVEEDATFDLRLDDGAVNVIGKVGVGREHIGKAFLGVYSKLGANRGWSWTKKGTLGHDPELMSGQGMVAMEPLGPTNRAPPSG